VPPGGRLFLAGGAGEPASLAEGINTYASSLQDVELVSLPLRGVNPCRYVDAQMRGRLRARVFTFTPALTRPMADGRVEYVSVRHSEIPRLLADPAYRFDVAFLQGTLDGDGDLNLGLWADLAAPVIANSDVVVAELNPQLPATCGETKVHAVEIDYTTPGQLPPRGSVGSSAGPVAREIAANVARVVPDGATFQIGIGALADAVVAALGRRRDLGVHSGMISDAVVDLVRSGAVTGRRKELDTGKIVVTQCLGSQVLWDFVHQNESVELRPATYVHAEKTMRAFERFYALNFALEVDLQGRANSEWMAGSRVGAVGGQMDFMRSAARSPHGGAIVALPSTARRGAVSRIVPRIDDAYVTLDPTDVGIVVTEYGVADIRGLDVGKRDAKLAAIAHPSFRRHLLNAAR
jgi:acyl-CoA hydrolase